MYTGRDRARKPSFQDRLNALRIHHGKLHRKRSRGGNKPVEGGLLTGSEPTVIRREHREDKNLTLDAARSMTGQVIYVDGGYHIVD